MQITLLKKCDAKIEPETPDAIAMRRFLFEMIDGATEKDTKAWRRFIGAMNKATSGSYFVIKVERLRNKQFHKLCFAVILAAFKAQEFFEDIGIFRQWIKLGANFCDYVPNSDGDLIAIPKSQSFDDCSEEEARQFFDDMCTFLRSPNCCATLWPMTPIENSMNGMVKLLSQFDQM